MCLFASVRVCVHACVCGGGCVCVCLQMLASVHVYMCVWRRLAGRWLGGRSKKDMKVEENDMIISKDEAMT